MINDGKKQRNIFYFISDAHLGPDLPYPSHRETILLDFFRQIRNNADQLFIIGDLFDFWIEYRHVIRSDYFNVLCALARLVQDGIKIHYIAGNHDFALGPFLTDHIGIRVHRDFLAITRNEKHIYLTHGDGLIDADKGYRLLKIFLRNPILQKSYRLLHPSMGIGMASFFSKLSRRQEVSKGPKFGHQAYRKAAWALAGQGYDVVIMGHTHRPEIIHRHGKIYCNTGDWIKSFTYASLESDTLRLWRYRQGRAPVEIAPIILTQ